MRVVGGEAKGRTLKAPRGRGTRPTGERTREALFSALTALRGSLDGARVLDLYAGSGAVGLEALSRGAACATLVDDGHAALTALRANATALGLDGADIRPVAVERLGVADTPYDVVFADPPYDLDSATLAATLTALCERGWIAESAVVVVERATRDDSWTWPGGFEPIQARRYGEGTLWYGRRAGAGPDDGETA